MYLSKLYKNDHLTLEIFKKIFLLPIFIFKDLNIWLLTYSRYFSLDIFVLFRIPHKKLYLRTDFKNVFNL